MTWRPATGAPWVFATLLILCGAALAAGGLELTLVGGSWYYLVAGIVLLADGVLLWGGRRAGLWVYGVLLAYTILWSFWEIGLDPWALASRIAFFLVLGVYLLFPRARRGLS